MAEYNNRDCNYYLLVLPAEADPSDALTDGFDVISLPDDFVSGFMLDHPEELSVVTANISNWDDNFLPEEEEEEEEEEDGDEP